MMRFLRNGWVGNVVAGALALGLLGGCGGGGGGGNGGTSPVATTPVATPPVANAAPVPALALAGQVSAGGDGGDVVVVTGTDVSLDATGSKDPDGDAVTYRWSLAAKPTASTADIAANTGTQLSFKPDVAGTYIANLRVTDSKGAYAERQATIVARTSTPGNTTSQVVLASMVPATTGGTANVVAASVGYTVALTGKGSADVAGSTPTYAWTLVSKPAGSTAKLSASAGAFSQLVPDALGDYGVQVVTTGSSGATSTYQTTVSVKNQRPQAVIGTDIAPTAQTNGSSIRLQLGRTLALRGAGSTDADGDALTYAWTLQTRPAGSAAALSSATAATVQLTTDVAGSYQVRLRVTDPSGAYAEQVLNIDSNNKPPIAQVDKTDISMVVGTTGTLSAAFSSDDDGDPLTYHWTIDARPAGSAATIPDRDAVQVSFAPDVAGQYTLSVTVSDGKSVSQAYVTVRALSSLANLVALPFMPLEARYSKGLDRFVAAGINPNALYIVDPSTGSTRSVPLPLPVKAMNLSADGRLAAVLQEGVVSLVDVASATLLHSSSTGGSQTDAFVTNAGMVYMIGQTGGQWVNPAVSIVDGRSGTDLTASLTQGMTGFGYFYGTQRGIFAASKNKVFLIAGGLSPADISYFTLDPTTGAVKQAGDSPYHGDYPMSTPLFLSSDDNLLFTSSGNFFRTDTLQYVGRFSMTGQLLSMSHSTSASEAIVLSASAIQSVYPSQLVYESSYHRFTGSLLLPAGDLALPSIGGLQSYGIGIFHNSSNNHVVLVQTGSPNANAAGVKYYLIVR